MLEETWSMGRCTRRILAVGAAAAAAAVSQQGLEFERNKAREGIEKKKVALPNYSTAADGTKNKKLKRKKTCEVWIVLHRKHEHARAREHVHDHSSMSTNALEHELEHSKMSTRWAANQVVRADSRI